MRPMGAPLPGTPEWQSYLRRTVLEAFERFSIATNPKKKKKMKDSNVRSIVFNNWASEYFSQTSEARHLDIMIPLKDVLAVYRKESGRREMTMVSFWHHLEAFAIACPYIAELNPAPLCNVKPTPGRQNGRILRRLHDRDGCATGPVVDHIYMRSMPVLSDSEESD